MVLPLNIPQIDTFSDEELTSLCLANPDLSIERDENGQIFINMSPTYALTSLNNSELNTEVSLWNRQQKAGKVFDSNSAFILPDTSMRGPDVAWVQKERWNKLSLKEKNSFRSKRKTRFQNSFQILSSNYYRKPINWMK